MLNAQEEKVSFDYKKYLKAKTYTPLIDFNQPYPYLLGRILVFAVFYLIVARINSLAGIPMNQERYDQAILELDRITFDEEAIERIKELQNRDVKVDLDLPSDRENPF